MLSEYLEQGGHQAFGPECPLPRAGSAHRRPGRPHRRGDHRHQHGRPRHRHPARRQPRVPDRGRAPRHVAEAPERERRRSSASGRRSRPRSSSVLEAGGLFVLGTERHESRRIDNQLRGRSGRQGDPGLSRFYLSLDDDLLRIFGPQTMFARLMNKNLEDGEAIVSPVDLQGDRDRPEEGRGAQLRYPQAGRRIRRRDERPAQGHLRAARRHHGRRQCQRRGRRLARRYHRRRSSRSAAPRAPIPSSGTSSASRTTSTTCSASIRRSTPGSRKKRSSRRSIIERLQELADDKMAAKLETMSSRTLDPGREADPDPDARPSLEGASRHARRAAPGDPPAQLCAEEADRRI